MTDELPDDMIGDPDAEGAAKQKILMLSCPALSSLELSIMELRLAENEPDGLLPIHVEFSDREDGPAALPDPPEMRGLRQAASDFWLSHLSLVRSLGASATYESYAALCRKEFMTPLKIRE